MRPVIIAQIGVGYWGPNLLRNLVAATNGAVKTIVDLSEERRAYVQGLYPHIGVTAAVDDVLGDPSIDAVVIATPVHTHFALTMAALKAGKHVLVEKPMAETVEEVEAIAVCAAERQLVAMVGHTFLYNPAVRYLKELVTSGVLGDIRYIYSQRLNLGRIRSDVDALWNLAPHDVSIIQYLLNDLMPLSVNRQGMDYVQPGVNDVSFLDIVYPNKVMAHIHVSWLDPHKVRSMTVVGSQKMVVYDDIAEHPLAIYDKGIDRMAELGKNMDYDRVNFPAFKYRSGDVYLPKVSMEEPLKIEIAHFIDCITQGVPCLTGPDHARMVVGILAGTLETAKIESA